MTMTFWKPETRPFLLVYSDEVTRVEAKTTTFPQATRGRRSSNCNERRLARKKQCWFGDCCLYSFSTFPLPPLLSAVYTDRYPLGWHSSKRQSEVISFYRSSVTMQSQKCVDRMMYCNCYVFSRNNKQLIVLFDCKSIAHAGLDWFGSDFDFFTGSFRMLIRQQNTVNLLSPSAKTTELPIQTPGSYHLLPTNRKNLYKVS